jgi:N-acyl-L-homoserine lactone synthetase
MIHTIDHASTAQGAQLRAMFEARKKVFVDLLKWDVPVVGGTWELDAFDDSAATYLVLTDDRNRHLASARLLRTTRPHILSSLFPQLVDGEVPEGPDTYEITRFCLDRSLRAFERRLARDRLVSGLVEHAMARGISRYTGVAEIDWYRQIAAFGWTCAPLGTPKHVGSSRLTAMAIEIAEDTPERLAARDIWSTRYPAQPPTALFSTGPRA